MGIAKPITDKQIERAWEEWEQPQRLQPILETWLEMSFRERAAFFCGLVLPEVFGRSADTIPLSRVLGLRLASRFPEKVCSAGPASHGPLPSPGKPY